MKEPILLIMAAGMGSRYGGLKQMDPIGPAGEVILHYSVYDAMRAGFKRVVFLIKHEIEEDFKAAVGRRMEKYFDVKYVFQQLDKLPAGYAVPEGRVKPWGTGHAVLCAKDAIDGPFAVINADDFYGASAYQALYDFLSADGPENEHALVGYELRNTVTEHGTVARGICAVEDGCLTGVVERTKIKKDGADAAFTEDDGATWTHLPGESVVSMNFWGFRHSMLDELERRFPAWLDANLPVNPLKAEYFLPFVANALIQEQKGKIRVLSCRETWHGITYREDMDSVVGHIASLREQGVYPETLLD